MGEAKQEETTKADAKPAEEKKEEKAEEKKEEAKAKAEEKKEEAKPSPPQPIILSMDLHCVGCAKKIERCIMRCKGVEEVETDMNQNKVTVKGIVDPQVLCARIKKKTMRTAKVLSPLPPPDAAPDSAASQEVASQVSGMTTVELQVNMHCEACAQQLQRKILKMKGVQTAETELSSGKVKVTGTMTAERLVVDIYRRTGKLASVIPPPPPPPPPAPKEEEKKEEGEKKAEEKPPEEKKEEKGAGGEEEKKKEEEKAAEQPPGGDKGAGETKEGEKGSGSEEAKKEPEPAGPAFIGPEDVMMKRMMYWNNGYFGDQDEMAKRMMMPAPPPPWTHMPVYFIQPPPPPPQLFSDENPNACCIS